MSEVTDAALSIALVGLASSGNQSVVMTWGHKILWMRRESQQDRSTGHVSAGEMGIPSLCVKAILGDLWHGVSGLSEPGICSGKVETRVTQACGGISGTGGGVGSGDLDRNGHVGIVCEGISRDVVSCRPCVESSDCHV